MPLSTSRRRALERAANRALKAGEFTPARVLTLAQAEEARTWGPLERREALEYVKANFKINVQ